MIKSILWTSLFWIIVLAGWYGFVRYIASDDIQNLVLPREEMAVSSEASTSDTELESLRQGNNYMIQQIDQLSEQIQALSDQKAQNQQTDTDSLMSEQTNDDQSSQDQETETSQEQDTNETTINLYYFNERVDNNLPENTRLNTSSVQPIQRTIASTDFEEQLEEAIRLLIQGELTENEIEDGFVAGFDGISLESVEFNEYGIAIINLVQEDTSINGSARVILLRDAIAKTAEQFDEVRSTLIMPEDVLKL